MPSIILSSVLLWMLSFLPGLAKPVAAPPVVAAMPPLAPFAGALVTQFTALVRGSRAPPAASA